MMLFSFCQRHCFSVSPPDKSEDTDPERLLAVIGKDISWKYDNHYDYCNRAWVLSKVLQEQENYSLFVAAILASAHYVNYG